MTQTYISIEKAIAEYPSKAALADALGISRQAVNGWKHRSVEDTDVMPHSSAGRLYQVNPAAAKRCRIKIAA